MPNDIDEFNDHVDVGNHESAKRFLAFFFYLNDTDDRVVVQSFHISI